MRELKNLIERMVILNDEVVIEKKFLPQEIFESCQGSKLNVRASNTYECLTEGFSLEEEVRKLEVHYISIALEQAGGNYSNASKLLGISRHALNRRMDKYGKN